jgi:hypothetical protein
VMAGSRRRSSITVVNRTSRPRLSTRSTPGDSKCYPAGG